VESILDYAHGNFRTEISKIIIGKEIAPTTGTAHLQGFIKFTSKKRLWNLVKLWGGKAHWEAAGGSEKANRDYCSKGGQILVQLGLNEEEIKQSRTVADKQDYWNQVVKDAYTMGPEQFAEKWPKEWLIRRGAVERLMLDAAKKSMRVWNGDLKAKNVWI
jgi:hypothetical protein